MSPVESCIACGGAAHGVLQRIREYTIEQCVCCGLARTRGAAFEFADLYDRAYFVGTEAKGYNDYFALGPALVRTNRTRLRRLRRMAPAARRLLDVGCGPGFFLQQARASGLSASGLEVSPFAAAYGRDQFGLHIVEGLLNEDHLNRLPPRYDLITLWDVIEHLPDPVGAAGLLADRLSPGGLLTLSTGDVRSLAARLCGRRWHLYNLPEHLWFFTEESLRRLLERAGLVVERVRREVCWYTARYLLDRLCYSLSRPPLKLPGMRLLEKVPVPCSLFDIITVHARKPAGHVIACRPAAQPRLQSCG
jgi:SAM-dependent methyltransferase